MESRPIPHYYIVLKLTVTNKVIHKPEYKRKQFLHRLAAFVKVVL